GLRRRAILDLDRGVLAAVRGLDAQEGGIAPDMQHSDRARRAQADAAVAEVAVDERRVGRGVGDVELVAAGFVEPGQVPEEDVVVAGGVEASLEAYGGVAGATVLARQGARSHRDIVAAA